MAGANGRHKTGSLSNNELELVNTMANEVVVNALENGNMQHPDVPQDSHSISSDVVAFFRAQGASVTFELPFLPMPLLLGLLMCHNWLLYNSTVIFPSHNLLLAGLGFIQGLAQGPLLKC